jgi:hypothetical protein
MGLTLRSWNSSLGSKSNGLITFTPPFCVLGRGDSEAL